MADFSFDVVSKVDLNVISEAVSAANKEITNRYDFKGTNSSIELLQKESELKLASSDEYKVNTLRDIIFTRMAKRGIALKNLQPQKIEAALGGNAKQTVKIQQGIPADKAKEITKTIKDAKLKVSASIQGDQLRVSSKSKDELQAVIALLKGHDFGVDLQFTNYR
ncbi:MAG: YajQ family cyclic di-GMP-binding protein [Elusimicrobiaceae bacterium]|nr:YajQ family cyclic di-GMP-binding protein [Elusimicrobiaceae bacterium]MBP5616662.1 YajQ family cyclic di-GMP-binding protein [Elusimicrobiaceae bacterium]